MNIRFFSLFFVCSLISGLVFSQKLTISKSDSKKYPFQKGSLIFDKDNIKMNYVKNTEIRKDTIRMKNVSGLNITLGLRTLPAYLSCNLHPDTLKPGMEGFIDISFNAAKKGDYGYCFENLNFITNDTSVPEKYFFVMAYIEEDFSGLTQEQRDNAPKIKFEEESIDFGRIKTGSKFDYTYKFTNIGKSDLIIRKTKATCGCTATQPEKSILKPGESSQILVKFDSSGLKGEQHKTVFVYCNDPRYSTVALHFKGEVIE
ncbi:MAG: DUF1573 domain-containing protein [Bacteroidales bacterium]